MAKQISRRSSAPPGKVLENKAVTRQPVLYYHLHTLLHTLRSIGTFEDQLCTLLEEIKVSSAPSAELMAELDQLLVELPSIEYVQEIDVLRTMLPRQNASSEEKSQRKATPKKTSV